MHLVWPGLAGLRGVSVLSGWWEYATAWALFLLTHLVPVRPPVKPWLVARLGRAGFGLGYSVLSLGAVAWLIIVAGRAPYVGLWAMPAGAHWIVLAAVSAAVLVLALSLGRPNPFSFGGAKNERFDPTLPEIVRVTRHPVLMALALWSAAHVLVNGDVAHVLMFGGFAGFALLGQNLIDRRKRREMGHVHWQSLYNQTRQARPGLPPQAGLRLFIGVFALAVLVFGHKALSGVAIWQRFLL